MAVRSPSIRDVGLPDVGFGVLTLGSLASTLFVQLLWIIAFDERGLDAAVPDLIFTGVLPALTVALLPTLAAYTLYSRRTAVAVTVGVTAAAFAVSRVTIGFFALCGPGC